MEEEYNLIKMKHYHQSKTKDLISPIILMGVEEDDYEREDDSTDVMDRFAGQKNYHPPKTLYME